MFIIYVLTLVAEFSSGSSSGRASSNTGKLDIAIKVDFKLYIKLYETKF